jgi:protocatechuate 3,4-dioxygenase beta subunit
MTTHNSEHSEFHAGLRCDLSTIEQRIQERRQVLGWIVSGAAAAVIAACGGANNSSSTSNSTSSTSSSGGSASSGSCVADPAETNGPYPADGTNTVNGASVNVLSASGIVRSDIRGSFGSSSTVADGVPLLLTINLVDTNATCALLTGYAIYVWHCNRDGEYSLYSSAIQTENYLRGVQVTGDNGQVTFQTIFPACYSGRYPHIHVEVYKTLASATGESNAILTTQMAMPRDVCTVVYGNAAGYGASVATLAAVTVSDDNVFDSSTAAEITAQTPSLTGSVTDGYTGTVTIGVAV